MRRFTVILLVFASVFAAMSVLDYAESSHPRRAVLWVGLAFVALIGAWLSFRATRDEASPRAQNRSSR
jgi:hypothetical protein